MIKTAITLADGRELVYYDSDASHARAAAPDRRTLEPFAPALEMRHDPLLDEWVAIAAHRQGRSHLPPADECPLCPSTPTRLTEIPASDYEVVVFENRFPSFASGGAPLGPAPTAERTTRRPAAGRCEVVCFTSDHHASFAALTVERARLVVDAWADRTEALAANPDVEQVYCFENRGEAIGVTLHHPHGQIYGYPYVTPRTTRMLESARRHRNTRGTDLFAEVLDRERELGTRVVRSSTHWTAFVPGFARWPFEVHLYPHRAVADLPALTPAERDDFAHVYLDVLGRLDALFARPLPYVSAWHQAPVRVSRELIYLHLQLFSIQRAPNKLKFLAGSESGMGAFVSDVVPEDAARMLREVHT